MAEPAAPTVAAFVPDLMDRSRLTGIDGVTFVSSLEDLARSAAATVVVDLGRPGVLASLATLSGRRVIGFGSHVDHELLAAARAAGCTDVLPRSTFFARARELLS